MINRRDFIKTSVASAGALAMQQNIFAGANKKQFPTRFIFMTKGNGLLPETLAPPSFSNADKAKDKAKEQLNADLTKHDLPKWMSVLESHKKDMAIIQGISCKFANGHDSHQACLGVFSHGVDRHLSKIKWATVDVELGRLYPSPFEHIEVQAVSNNRGIVAGRAATGKMKYNYAYADPKTAFTELFKSAAKSVSAKNALEVDSMVLNYLKQNSSNISRELTGVESLKLTNYKKTVEQIQARDQQLKSMSEVISKNIPKLDEKYFSESATTIERQQAFTEILLGALKSGLTNSVLFSVDSLKTKYTGLPKLDPSDIVEQHDVGHGKGMGEYSSLDIREMIREHHMNLMNRIADSLKKTPEGNGTMFDNTVIMYQPATGETHHSTGAQQPIVMIAGKNTKMNFLGNYIRLPFHGKQGHKTLGNWYTTILNNHGNPISHFGQFDHELSKLGIDQKGPIKEFLV